MNMSKEILREYVCAIADEQKVAMTPDLVAKIRSYDFDTFDTLLSMRLTAIRSHSFFSDDDRREYAKVVDDLRKNLQSILS